MKIYTNINVLDAVRARMHRLYSEEQNICVSVSGGKDSTVMMELAIEAARSLGRLPIDAMFFDQEAEYDATIDYMRYLQTRSEEIKLYWFQIPFVLTNSTSLGEDNYLHAWREGETWLRDKEPNTIHECKLKAKRFHSIIAELGDWIYDYKTHFSLIGIRADESRIRTRLMARAIPAYKDIRWASFNNHGYNMYPMYDWKTQDIWKYIYENNIVYNKVYDNMYRAGVRRTNMRVSSLIHETGHWALKELHKIEPDTYSKLSERIDGVADYHTGGYHLFVPKELPVMFSNWVEYRDYLLEKLIAPEHQEQFRKRFDKYPNIDDYARGQVAELVLNDYEGVKNGNAQAARDYNKFTQSRIKREVGSD